METARTHANKVDFPLLHVQGEFKFAMALHRLHPRAGSWASGVDAEEANLGPGGIGRRERLKKKPMQRKKGCAPWQRNRGQLGRGKTRRSSTKRPRSRGSSCRSIGTRAPSSKKSQTIYMLLERIRTLSLPETSQLLLGMTSSTEKFFPRCWPFLA